MDGSGGSKRTSQSFARFLLGLGWVNARSPLSPPSPPRGAPFPPSNPPPTQYGPRMTRAHRLRSMKRAAPSSRTHPFASFLKGWRCGAGRSWARARSVSPTPTAAEGFTGQHRRRCRRLKPLAALRVGGRALRSSPGTALSPAARWGTSAASATDLVNQPQALSARRFQRGVLCDATSARQA